MHMVCISGGVKASSVYTLYIIHKRRANAIQHGRKGAHFLEVLYGVHSRIAKSLTIDRYWTVTPCASV